MVTLKKKTFKDEASMLEWLEETIPNEMHRMVTFHNSRKNLTVHYMHIEDPKVDLPEPSVN